MEQKDNRVRTALITGAMTGLGPAYVEYFGKLGYSLILTGKDKKALRIFVEEIEETYRVPVSGLEVDLSDPGGLSMICRQTDMVSVDVLINNAADEDWDQYGRGYYPELKRMLSLQMNSAVSLTLAILRRMINRNEGIIVNVSPDGVARPSSVSRIRTSSMVFIRQFTEGLNNQLADTGIRIQAVYPGSVAPLIAMFGNRRGKQMHIKNGQGGIDPLEIVSEAMKDLEHGNSFSYASRRGFFTKRSEYFAG